MEMRAQTAFEHAAMGSAAGKAGNGEGAIFAIVPRETPHDLPPAAIPAPNRVKFTLKRIEGHRDMLLFIENGYQVAIGYHAEFANDPVGKSEPTSTCPVLPGAIGVEHWPHSFDYLKISDPVIVKEGDPIDASCVAPVKVEPVPGLS